MFGKPNGKNKNGFVKRAVRDIAPDEIFLDSKNLPKFNTHQFEGRIEKPISSASVAIFSVALALVALALLGRTSYLQIARGEEYAEQAENNRLDHSILFAERGVIYDRNGFELAWNETASTSEADFAHRAYADVPGLAHVLGFVGYPKKDISGNYFETTISGKDGVEKVYDKILAGAEGRKIVERDAVGEVVSQSFIQPPEEGEPLHLTIDSRLQSELYTAMSNLATEVGFEGGASVILEVTNGDVLALASFPSYDAQIMSEGEDAEKITQYSNDSRTPFLNRAVSGLYAPGSIVKPFLAAAALTEHIIDPLTTIYSDGAMEVENPYDPERPSIFRDWKAHGAVDMRSALAVSSDIYFYHIGGGYGAQRGLGIAGIEKYMRMFGVGSPTGIDLPAEESGVIPSVAWKEKHFPGDPWRVGDTYNSSIGQYGFQVTPLEMARAVAAIANGGNLVVPHLLANSQLATRNSIPIDDTHLQIVREGMRMAVTEGTAAALNVPYVEIAAKSGTAELGTAKQKVNSWLIGLWPYGRPRYAFATVMERGPAANIIGSAYVMRNVFDWIHANAPEYLQKLK